MEVHRSVEYIHCRGMATTLGEFRTIPSRLTSKRVFQGCGDNGSIWRMAGVDQFILADTRYLYEMLKKIVP